MVQTVEMLRTVQIDDINFGCLGFKVCKNDAGAALLRDPDRESRWSEQHRGIGGTPTSR